MLDFDRNVDRLQTLASTHAALQRLHTHAAVVAPATARMQRAVASGKSNDVTSLAPILAPLDHRDRISVLRKTLFAETRESLLYTVYAHTGSDAERMRTVLRHALLAVRTKEPQFLLLDRLLERDGSSQQHNTHIHYEYMSFIVECVALHIVGYALSLISSNEHGTWMVKETAKTDFSMLIEDVLRFDKTLASVHWFDGREHMIHININERTINSTGCLIDAFCNEYSLLTAWIHLERDAADYRFEEIVNDAANPWGPSISSGLLKHTSSSEKLIDLLAAVTERYKPLRIAHQAVFFQELQLRILNKYLSIAKDTLNAYEHTFEPTTNEAAVLHKFQRLEKVLRVAASLFIVSEICCEWSEDTVYLEMLSHLKSFDTKKGDPLHASVFSSVNNDYIRVITQIQDIVADDCLQYVVESMWRYDQKKWSGEIFASDAHSGPSPELSAALTHIAQVIDIFEACSPVKLFRSLQRALLSQLMDRLLLRPVTKFKFSLSGAQQFAIDMGHIWTLFRDPSLLKLVKSVKIMQETLLLLNLETDQILSLYHDLKEERDSAKLLQNIGIKQINSQQVVQILKQRV